MYAHKVMVIIGLTMGMLNATPREGSIVCDVSYLFWKAHEDHLQYASRNYGDLAIFENPLNSAAERILNPTFRGHSGVRIGIGYVGASDWKAEFVWTHLAQSICNAQPQVEQFGYNATALFLFNPSFAQSVSQRWNMHFNTAEWTFAQRVDLCEKLWIRPFCGLTYASITQRQCILYNDVVTLGQTTMQFDSATVLMSNRMHALGIHVGMANAWNIVNKLALLSSAKILMAPSRTMTSFTSLFGDLENAPVLQETVPPHALMIATMDPAPSAKVGSCNNVLRMQAALTCSIGLGVYDIHTCYADWSCDINFEAQYWPNHLQAFSSSMQPFLGVYPGGGDLLLYGLTLAARCAF